MGTGMGQTLLFPDPKPLDQRLGKKFFRRAPRRPGVYLMKDASDKVLYVGKAKDLKQRLNNYRTANPDRMPRRHLRMVNEVSRIEFHFCPTEAAALKHEKKLIRSLKPRFNRAAVWPGKTRFIVWRRMENYLELAVADVPEPAWQRYGPLGAGSHHLHKALSRMLWLALNPNRAYTELPPGWAQGVVAPTVRIDCRESVREVAAVLAAFFWESSDEFLLWLGTRLCERTHPFERNVINSELEMLREFSLNRKPSLQSSPQLALL
jgi:predicted GIY-YIG superfamily endonuclease